MSPLDKARPEQSAGSESGGLRAPIQVSVVITTYNQSEFLARAIESVFANTEQPAEILVVDDGSIDASASEICSRYPGVRFIRQANQGASVARNTGTAGTTADWILYLDADDMLLPSAIAELAGAAESSPEAAFVIGRCERRSSDVTAARRQSPPAMRTDNPYDDLLFSGALWHPAQMIFNRHRVLEAGGWLMQTGAEDLELLLRLAVRHPYQCVPAVVSVYWQHSSNVSGNQRRMYRALSTCLDTHRKDPRFIDRYRRSFLFARSTRLDFYARGILLSGLSDARNGAGWSAFLGGLGFVSVRRPAVLGWLLGFLMSRAFGKRRSDPQTA